MHRGGGGAVVAIGHRRPRRRRAGPVPPGTGWCGGPGLRDRLANRQDRHRRASHLSWSACAASPTWPKGSAPRSSACSRSSSRRESRRNATGSRSPTGCGPWRPSPGSVAWSWHTDTRRRSTATARSSTPASSRPWSRRGPAGHLRRGELRAVRGPPLRRGLPAAPPLPGLPADEGRSGGHRRGRPGRAGQRAGPRDPRRPAGRRLCRICLARAASGYRGALRSITAPLG